VKLDVVLLKTYYV